MEAKKRRKMEIDGGKEVFGMRWSPPPEGIVPEPFS